MKAIIILFGAATLFSCAAIDRAALPKDGPVAQHLEKYNWKRAIAPASFALASGVCLGFHETSVHHPDAYPDGWNPLFWDNRISWTNKYQNGDKSQGANYFGSRSFLAWTTDAKHLFGTAHRLTMFGAGAAFGLSYRVGERRKWWHYAADAGISFAAFAIGFHGVYSVAFR